MHKQQKEGNGGIAAMGNIFITLYRYLKGFPSSIVPVCVVFGPRLCGNNGSSRFLCINTHRKMTWQPMECPFPFCQFTFLPFPRARTQSLALHTLCQMFSHLPTFPACPLTHLLAAAGLFVFFLLAYLAVFLLLLFSFHPHN